MRWFVRQSIKGGRVCAFSQLYESKICDDVFKIISEKINVKRNVYYNVESNLEHKNKHLEVFNRENKCKFSDYRDKTVEEKEVFINEF